MKSALRGGTGWASWACILMMVACQGGSDAPDPFEDRDVESADTSNAQTSGADSSGSSTADTSSSASDIASPVDGTTTSETQSPPPSEEDVSTGPQDIEAPEEDSVTGPGDPPSQTTDPCLATSAPTTRDVVLPLGETLFFKGDDYLAFWGTGLSCDPELSEAPEGAKATLLSDAEGALRLTPDMPGTWTIIRGQDTVVVSVDDAYLTPDTFVNFNYSPVTPIVQTSDGALWVASPVSNAVHRVTLDSEGTPTPGPLVPSGSWPTALATWSDPEGEEWLLVSQTGRDSLGFLNPTTHTLVDAVLVGNEPAGLIVSGDVAYVALSGEDTVARVDLTNREVTDVVAVGHDPRAMVLDEINGRLFVASLLSGNAHPQGPVQEQWIPTEDQRDVAVIDTESFSVSAGAHEVGTILRGLWLDEDATELLVSTSHAHNTALEVDADTQPQTHALVRVDIDVTSETTLTVLGEVDLDGQPSSMGPAASPYTMATTPSGEHLIVTLAAGQAILVLDAESREEVERLPAGSDPRGMVFAEGRMWTYAWLDNQLVGWPLPGEAGERLQATVGDDPTPLEVKQGQRIFNDASFSKRGEFSCNNCHIDGITDGLVWDLLTDGPVNTMAFRNVGGTAPFLWGGQLPTLFDFSREVLKLVGASASGTQMQLLTTYMQSVTAPPNPYTLPGGKLTPEAEAGKALFEGEANCGGCHSGTLLTNQSMVDGKTEGVKTDVPSLFGAYDTGPWGREGQWTTLEDMVAYAAEFTGSDLSPEELAELTAYVREQPADTLYLTSSKPLNHAHHIWHGTSVELTFSAALRPGQEAAFSFWRVDADSSDKESVPGEWSVSGRKVRFVPESDFMLNTAYHIDVAAGLEGSLGQSTTATMTIDFETGGLPGLDTSGNWSLEACQSSFGCFDVAIALLQSDGGQVTGVALDNFDEGEVDHLEGVMDGDTLILDPFTIDSVIGPIFVATGVTLATWDNNDDGYADAGEGQVPFEFNGTTFLIDFYANRLTLPEESDDEPLD